MIYTPLILLASSLGILLCIDIYKKKQRQGPLVCYLGADCETVVRGKFSSFLGIGLEILGGLYYSLILLVYLALLLFALPSEPLIYTIIVIISGLAFFMSVVLTFIQAFVIRTWCSWCLISAGVSTLIFILGLISIL